MTIVEEYKNQNSWRNWISCIEKLPVNINDTILDLGCGTGHVAKLLAERSLRVIGIDMNAGLIREAEATNKAFNIQYIVEDLKSLDRLELPMADGIWTSFAVAYFPVFAPLLKTWINLLKPYGWIAIVEVNDLFAHFPVSQSTRNTFKKYYERQRTNNIYDFEMGSKIKDFLINEKMTIIIDENLYDRELAFNGPADKQILVAWENRLDRMAALQNYTGKDQFAKIKDEFLQCLVSEKHFCETEVKYIVAKKN